MSVTSPQGFRASGVTAGLKDSGDLDLAIVVNDGPKHTAAAVFTSNRVVGAPVTVSKQHMESGQARAVILNSGGANVCTGNQGILDAKEMTAQTAGHLGVPPEEVLVASTGIIGTFLPMEKIVPAVEQAVGALDEGPDGGAAAAQAIMTTDTVAKEAKANGNGYLIGGMAKGAGMLAPGMATMLSVITTDAVIDSATAQAALSEAVRTTFNRVDSDGCLSTSDTVVLLASGASEQSPDAREFTETLRQVCATLARALVADAEGATHDIEITVKNAHSEEGAEAVARAVSRSNLFKTAIYGNDPNWGRILAEVGTVPEHMAAFNAADLAVSINEVMVCREGMAHEDRSKVDLAANREVRVVIDLNAGADEAVIWTNDLTHDYIHENSAYST